jgi:DNA recombination protein RmuC
MDTTLMLLLGLVLGAAIGSVVTFLLLRPRLDTSGGARGSDDALGTSRTDQAQRAELREVTRAQLDQDAARREALDRAQQAELRSSLAPISQSLAQLEQHLARSEQDRSRADGALRAHLTELSARTEQLDQGTNALATALRAPTSRGRWGEVQLRRIVEAAGMLEHVDFTEQQAGRRADGEKGQRPDLLVRLTGGRSVVVDAKAPMDAYLDAVEQTDPDRAQARRQAHAKALRHHVDVLARKSYWAGLGDTPEFTVLFVPSDGVLAAALESDPDLLEHGFASDVVIASPATLVALLRTVAHTWRTDSLNRDARSVLETGRELHHRLGTLIGHLGKVGRSLDSSVAAFNEAVGSLQSRVMVTSRKFEEMALVGTPLEEVEQLTRRPRTLDEDQIADLAAGDRGGQRTDERSAGHTQRKTG